MPDITITITIAGTADVTAINQKLDQLILATQQIQAKENTMSAELDALTAPAA